MYCGIRDMYYVFITEPYHVLWYKGQIDVYYVFITEPYHVLLYKGQIDVYYVFIMFLLQNHIMYCGIRDR